jgi:microcystin-dependent protein
VLGQKGGVETVTLILSQLPSHPHTAMGSNAASSSANPANNNWAANTVQSFGNSSNATMNNASTGNTGGNQPHDNMLNFAAVTFIIALYGIYPSQG